MFEKFKNFIANLFLKIKSLFIKIKPYIKKYGIIIIVSVLFLISLCSVDCYSAKARELTPTSNIVDNRNNANGDGNIHFYYDFGSTNQYVLTMGDNNTYNTTYVSAGLPIYLDAAFWDGDETHIEGYSISIGFGSHKTPFTSDMYNEIENYNYDFNHYFDSVSVTQGSSKTFISFSDNYTISNKDFYHQSYIFKFSLDEEFKSLYESNYSFGFPYCQTARYYTDLTVDGNSTFTNYSTNAQNGSTYFYLGGYYGGNIQKLVAYNVSYVEVPMALDTSKFYITSNLFEVHSFIFNDNSVIRYGYNVPSRYRPASSTTYYDTTYYLENNVGGSGGNGDLCFTQEELDNLLQNEFTEGWLEGADSALEDVAPTNFIKAMINNFLAIRLFGDVTLGLVFSLSFGILLFGLIIKIFLGG